MTPALVLTLLRAQEPVPLPPYPPAPAVVAGECLEPVALQMGQPVPAGLVGRDLRAVCSAVAMPVSQQADLLNIERWSVACRDQYAIVVQSDAESIAALTVDRDQWRTLAETRTAELDRSRAWFRQPAVSMAIGGLAVGVAVAGGAFLVAGL